MKYLSYLSLVLLLGVTVGCGNLGGLALRTGGATEGQVPLPSRGLDRSVRDSVAHRHTPGSRLDPQFKS